VTCREFADFIADYLSGQLPADARAEFTRHLGACSNCVAYLSAYRATIELGKRAFDDDAASLPAEVPAALIEAILAARR
jgi:anti-sigma factor RsiW